MDVKEFFNRYRGVKVDFDGYYGPQCVDLFNRYLVDVLDIKNPIQQFPVASAFQIWDAAKNNSAFKRIANTPTGVPQEGDIMVWKSTKQFPHGHVAIVMNAEVNSFVSFDQNWVPGQFPTDTTHDYLNPPVYGWLRPVKFDNVPVVKPENALIKFIKEWYSKLDGNKTNYTVIAIIVTVVLYNQGIINEDTLNLLDTIFLAMVGFSLRDAIKKK